MDKGAEKNRFQGWRLRTHEIIFEAETPAGKTFDVMLIGLILLSVVVVMMESIASMRENFGEVLRLGEWAFTVLFTIEYILRLICVGRPVLYARSFYGLVDLLSIIPTYLSLIVPGSQYLLVIRTLRILRVFRILRLVRYMTEASLLYRAIHASRRKIFVFLYGVMILVIIVGSLMYVIEGEENGFSSIPRSIYWAVVTLTTVGYGDIAPQTIPGQCLAVVVMIMGYGIIAVPTGIVTSELSQMTPQSFNTISCHSCSKEGHDSDAVFCKFCGEEI